MFRKPMICLIAWAFFAIAGNAQEAQSLVLRIKAVGKEGAGNVEAAKAFKQLVALGPGVMPDVLAGMDDANPIALNWLRAVESIHDRTTNAGQKIPAGKIEAFLKDTRHSSPARRLAYECLVKHDPKTPDRLLPTLLDDPAAELRRDAVEVKLKHGIRSAFDSADARKDFLKGVLKHARDSDQVGTLIMELKKLGVEIDPTQHYGFITRWQVIGPFDNGKGAGFHNVYPPEKGVDLKASYTGKDNQTIQWREHVVAGKKFTEKTKNEDLGVVDFNVAVGKLKGTVGYAFAAVSSETQRPVELRCGSNNAVRFYLNGKEVFLREEYHHGFEMDQHVGKGTLKAGRNEILVKVCQNEQTENWAESWSFQLRVCDTLGAAVPVVNVTEKTK